jgi:seryl-tRNA synthetase
MPAYERRNMTNNASARVLSKPVDQTPLVDHADLKKEWDFYTREVKGLKINDTAQLREINSRLGFPLAKAVPGLIKEIESLQSRVKGLQKHVRELNDALEESHIEMGITTA